MNSSLKSLVLILASAVLFAAAPAVPAGDTYYPLAKGNKWVYSTDFAEDAELIHEVIGTEKVGDVDCFVVEHKTVVPSLGPRMMRKEWLAPDGDGVMMRKVSRGKSEMEVVAPFFKIKHVLRKDDEWKGQAKAEENPPVYDFRVEGEEDVEVPRGSTRR